MSYNTLNSGCENDWSTRVLNFTPIISAINPDIIIQIELTGSGDTTAFINAINNSTTGPYTKGTYKTCSCSDRNLYYYKASEFTDSGNTSISSGGGNNFNMIKLYHKSTNNMIYIFALHLDPLAGGASSRDSQIRVLKSYIASNMQSSSNYIILGDFNIEGPAENAYEDLLDQSSSNSPYVFDPLNDPPDFTDIHWYDDLDKYENYFSVSTRNDNPVISCLNEGGSNKRFDMILFSNSIKNNSNYISYKDNSLTVYGQDGNHYNAAINTSPAVANAQYIYGGSDHFPVYADFIFNNNPLPVELVSFRVILNKSNVKLYWATETELMNYGFDVERSINTGEWIKLGFVPGNGNSSSPHDYTYPDTSIFASGNYRYRLKQIDTDGKSEYSSIVNLFVIGPFVNDLLGNFPNPFNPTTTIVYQITENKKVTLKIIDTLGRLVKTLVDGEEASGMHKVSFNATNLTSGTYIYQLSVGGKLYSKKMLLLK